jgi:multiple antibiotic resistance protein
MDPRFDLMFPIFLTTLGPLKTIPVFHALTLNAPWRYRAELALRATIEASCVAGFVVLAGNDTMERYRVSHDAMGIAGGVILFLSALRVISGFRLAALPAAAPPEAQLPRLRWMDRPTLSPLAVPTIVTPGGVVAILFFLARAGENDAVRTDILLMLAAMMLANLAGMLMARPVMQIVKLAPLQIIGWVFAVLQAALAVQAILNALERMHVVP